MSTNPLRLCYFAHSLRSDWNNGNAHFLRGLLKAMHGLGHDVTAYEPDAEWSMDNLLTEPAAQDSLEQFLELYADLDVQTYAPDQTEHLWSERLLGTDVVILHEWNPPALAHMLLRLRARCGFKLLFHDTHHRASSTPEAFAEFGLASFDGVIAFGQALTQIYRERFHINRVWTLHEAADTAIFRPASEVTEREQDVVWVGNWGEGERAAELDQFLIAPAAAQPGVRFQVYGVRYPQAGLDALRGANIAYGGYLPNLQAPAVYARSRLTLHVPRQQYSAVMTGIPTIRVFEALACGIPLLSAPWQDTESLFRPGDFRFVGNSAEMTDAIAELLDDPQAAAAQAARGLKTVLARHTCMHRAHELTAICQEVLA